MAYIKSHSNYVLKKKHQLIDGGVVYERDMTTIGGLNQFAPDQTPMYQSGNFIITINKDSGGKKDYGQDEWLTNADGTIDWTYGNVSASTEVDNTLEIKLKHDYYRLQDFAYFGSCSELIRSSLTDIITKFPGELYGPKFVENNISSGIPIYYKPLGWKEGQDLKRLGGDNLYLLDNPFNINLHSAYVDEKEFNEKPLKYFANEGYKNYEGVTNWSVSNQKDCVPLGGHICDINITYNNVDILIKAYLGQNNAVYYLVESKDLDKHIRPKTTYFEAFFKDLDEFQKVLLNRDSKPQYTALFEVISETDYGYRNILKKFTFPISYGGYNLAVNNQAYAFYLDDLSRIAAFYDERFCDNMYRSMTHEAIKNFDWTYTREFENGDEEEYVIGGTRVQQMIRLIGREFDEIRLRSEGIKSMNVLTYSDSNNMPNYFLTDALEIDGWDVRNVYPITLKDGKFAEDRDLTIEPFNYTSYTNNWQAVKCYHSSKSYSMNDVNNHFMKMLKLNSREILRHKGTIEGIEMMLGLFGLASDNFAAKVKNTRFSGALTSDYSIAEYVTFTTGLKDTDSVINNYNKKKTVVYDTDDYRNGIYHDYQGLPVREYIKYNDENEIENIYLYPFFSNEMEIDGHPYYQMHGGWLNKSHQYGLDDTLITDKYTNTIRNILVVDNLQELLSVPYNRLTNGCVYKVLNMNKPFVMVDGVLYELNEEIHKSDTATTNYCFIVTVNNNMCRVGETVFFDDIIVSSIDANGTKVEKTYTFDDMSNGSSVKIYVHGETITARQSDGLSVSNIYVQTNYEKSEAYFELIDKRHKNILGGNGWTLIQEGDDYVENILNLHTNYFKGNNPHNGNFKYDDGREYISYFTQLFKHAIDNDLFDVRCFKDTTDYENAKKEMLNIGFTDLKATDDLPCGAYEKYKDSKVHYFGDYVEYDVEGDTKVQKQYFYKEFGETYNRNEWPISATPSTNINILDQIVNVKLVDLAFKNVTTDNGELKYFDSVIIPYMSQVLPLNVIMNIIY